MITNPRRNYNLGSKKNKIEITNRGKRDYKSGQKDYKLGQGLQIGAKWIKTQGSD